MSNTIAVLILNSIFDGVEWSPLSPGIFTPGQEHPLTFE